MSAQYDFIPGLDLSSLSSATAVQIQQAITQIAPLANIGGVVVGASAPDVIGNPRFARYLWLDTSGGAGSYVVKFYDPDTTTWKSGTAAAGSIDSAAAIEDGLLPISKLDGTAGNIGNVIRINASKNAFEFVAPEDAIPTDSLDVNVLASAATDLGKFLRVSSAGVPTWESYDPVSNISGLLPNQLQQGLASNFLVTESDGSVAKWTSNVFGYLNNNTSGQLNIARLSATGATPGDQLVVSGGNWISKTPTIDVFATANYADVAVTSFATKQVTAIVTLAKIPKYYKVVLRCISSEGTYTAGDEVEITACVASGYPTAYAFIDGTTFAVSVGTGASTLIRKKNDAAAADTPTPANWNFRCYYIY